MRGPPDLRGAVALAWLTISGALSGCHRHDATVADCRAILDRLVELELKEQGFRDPALVPRWQEDLARQLGDNLARCRSVRVGDDLDSCLRAAQNPEEIAHRCVK